MASIAQWGTVQIDERELISLRLKYGIRLPKLQSIYYDPIIQFAGRDVTRIYLDLITADNTKLIQIWNDRLALSTSLRTVTIGGAVYGNFYLVRTEVEWTNLNFLTADSLTSRVTNSELITAKISLEGVQ